MPPKRNIMGGKAYKKKKRAAAPIKKLVERDDSGYQDYAVVTKKLGGCNLIVETIPTINDPESYQSLKHICHIRGKMRRRAWMNPGDLILISYRNIADKKNTNSKVDSIHKFFDDEIRQLLKRNPSPTDPVPLNKTIYDRLSATTEDKSEKQSNTPVVSYEFSDDEDVFNEKPKKTEHVSYQSINLMPDSDDDSSGEDDVIEQTLDEFGNIV